MQSTPDELYNYIADLMPENQFLQEINHLYTTWDKLINKNLIALYLVDKHGRNKQPQTTIHHLQPNQEYTITGIITTIYPEHTFIRKNGYNGRVLNLGIKDSTGTCRAVLWNDDANLIKQHNITKGTTIKLINGYTKDGRNGIEIHLGKWGMLETINQKEEQEPIQTPDITGILVSREPTRSFFKDNGDFGFITKINLKTKSHNYSVILWNEKVKEIQQFNIGDTLKLEQYIIKNNNGTNEIHLNGSSIITKT
jgi:hypothetical protein